MIENEYRNASVLWDIIIGNTLSSMPFSICANGKSSNGSALDYALTVHGKCPRYTCGYLMYDQRITNSWWRWAGTISNFRCILPTKEWDWTYDSHSYHCKHIGNFLFLTDYNYARANYADFFLNKRKMSKIQTHIQNLLRYARKSAKCWQSSRPEREDYPLLYTYDFGYTTTDCGTSDVLSVCVDTEESVNRAKEKLIAQMRAKGYDLGDFVSMVQNYDDEKRDTVSSRFYDTSTHISWNASVFWNNPQAWNHLYFSISGGRTKRVAYKQEFTNRYKFPLEVKFYVYKQVVVNCPQDDYEGTPKSEAHLQSMPQNWTCTELTPIETYTKIIPAYSTATLSEEHDVDYMPSWDYSPYHHWWQGPWGVILYRPYLAD